MAVGYFLFFIKFELDAKCVQCLFTFVRNIFQVWVQMWKAAHLQGCGGTAPRLSEFHGTKSLEIMHFVHTNTVATCNIELCTLQESCAVVEGLSVSKCPPCSRGKG